MSVSQPASREPSPLLWAVPIFTTFRSWCTALPGEGAGGSAKQISLLHLESSCSMCSHLLPGKPGVGSLWLFSSHSPQASVSLSDTQGQLLGKPEGGSVRPKQSEMLSPAVQADGAPQQMDKRWPGSLWGWTDSIFQTYCGFLTFCCLWCCLTKQDGERCMQIPSFHSPNRTDFFSLNGPHSLLDLFPSFAKEKICP